MPVYLVFRILGVSLFILGSLSYSGPGQIGCSKWSTSPDTDDVCCDICHPGNRLVKSCGPDPKKLCVPCENETYTRETKATTCLLCTQCVGGAQVLKKACTRTQDTECGCKTGLRCGNDECSFCVEECGTGQEPHPYARSCRNCSHGTFNDQIHEKCKPWRTSCPHPGERIVVSGDAVSDHMCSREPEVSTLSTNRDSEGDSRLLWALISLCVFFIILIICFLSFIKSKAKTISNQLTGTKKPPVELGPPTDDPSTLIDISYHQPQQEQGSISESLDSLDSETKLLSV
ncbi:hypothetical protein DPEC_G00010780 [Dallia pectoralis]|uniref:Uncharacterized protein n=1 Tax=Dallia pectoralis TaxID=75939 RepID=A0ACC2HLY7_DALPE|nr:hypothetical protein DPEC_G00010780 [Dallia pectoralis]